MGGRIRALAIVAVVLVAVVGATIWATRSNAPVPEYQNRVTMPGGQTHHVSLWLKPSAPTIGTAEVTAQIADPTGMPLGVDQVVFSLRSTGTVAEADVPGSYVSNAPTQDFLGRGHGYRTTLNFPDAGVWNIEVRFRMGDIERTTTFEIEVKG